MRILDEVELSFVIGGQNTAPTCSTVRATDGATGVVAHVTVCECPANTTMMTTVDGGDVTVTCQPTSPPPAPHPQP